MLLNATRDNLIVGYHPEARQKIALRPRLVDNLDERLRLAMVLAQSTALDITAARGATGRAVRSHRTRP